MARPAVSDVLALALTVAITVLAFLHHPTRAACPTGWIAQGVDPSGVFCCTPAPVGDPNFDGTFGHPDRSVQPPGVVCGRIYCTGGARPIAIGALTVGCQR